MFRRILLFLGLLLIAFFLYRRYDQSAADTLLYKVSTLSSSEGTGVTTSSGYITSFVNNEYDKTQDTASSDNKESETTTSSGDSLQATIDLSKKLTLGILNLSLASLQSGSGQESLSTAEQEFNNIIDQALNSTMEPIEQASGSNSIATGTNNISPSNTTTATTTNNSTTSNTTTTSTSQASTKSSLSARDKEEAEAFLGLFDRD